MNLFATDKNKSKEVRLWQLISRFTWEIPQTLTGLILTMFFTRRKSDVTHSIHKGINYIHATAFPKHAGISLGSIIITGPTPEETLMVHEFGHTVQSQRLGPLYLFVIGLPSLLWAALYKNIPGIRERCSYYDFIVEKQATKLGQKYF